MAADDGFFSQLQIARWYECECNWTRLVFSVTHDPSTSATSTCFFPLLHSSLSVESIFEDLRNQNGLLGPKTTRRSVVKCRGSLRLKWTETQLHEVDMKMHWSLVSRHVSRVVKITHNLHFSTPSCFSDVQVSAAVTRRPCVSCTCVVSLFLWSFCF